VGFAGNNDLDRVSPRRSFLFGRALFLRGGSLDRPRFVDLLRLADARTVSTPFAPLKEIGSAWFPTSAYRRVYRLEGGARFRFFASAIPAGGEDEARRIVLDPDRDPLAALVVEGDAGAPGAEGAAAVRTVRRRADREEVDVRSGGGWLFRSETYDPHWRGRIDGRAVPIVPADFAFQAVRVPAGEHRVEFVYSDPLVAAAMAISLAALFAVGWRIRRDGMPGRLR
jgi:hypothetical protein